MSRATLALLLLGLFAANLARAEEPAEPAVFALVIGVNRSVDPKLAPLRYADDDAARYQELFRLLGARTVLLARLDESTQKLHPQAAAEAAEPVAAGLARATAELAAAVAQARARGVETVLFFVYAGHGQLVGGQGTVALEDARLSGGDLGRVLDRIGAHHAHVIVDACHSYFFAYGRGPGGRRRPISGFARLPGLGDREDVGLLLSTSSARESHEWEALQAGVFSHEVRSGLYGAADADGDGRVSYREIAAFVARANAAVPNERYRPDVYVRPPRGQDLLMDLRRGLRRRLEIGGAEHAHYTVEDGAGNLLAEFHNGVGQAVRLLRPLGARLFLRRLGDEREYGIPAAPEVVTLADLAEQPATGAARGAAQEAFAHLFALPFDEAAVAGYRAPRDEPEPPLPAARRPRWRTRAGWGAVGGGAATVVGGALLSWWAASLRGTLPPDASQAQAAELNDRISNRNLAAGVCYGLGGAAVVGGALLLLWPAGEEPAAGEISFDGQMLRWQRRF